MIKKWGPEKQWHSADLHGRVGRGGVSPHLHAAVGSGLPTRTMGVGPSVGNTGEHHAHERPHLTFM